MKKKPSEFERFIALDDDKKDAEVARFYRPVDLGETKPLSPVQQRLWRKAKRKNIRK